MWSAFAAHNRFHYNCCDQSQGGTPSPEQVKAKSVENAQKRREARTTATAAATTTTSNKSGSPTSNGSSSSGKGESSVEHREVTPRQVTHYLLSHPKFLERHVQKYVDRQTLQRWVKERKMGKTDSTYTALLYYLLVIT